MPDEASIVRGCLPIHRILYASTVGVEGWLIFLVVVLVIDWWDWFGGLQFGLRMIVHRFWLLDMVVVVVVVSVGSHRMREVELFLVSNLITGLRSQK